MIVLAPGKLVLSGAYVVLDGAPAVVSAVGLYAVADSDRRGRAAGPELREAFGTKLAPLVDTQRMRAAGQKLGVGSSAAALVAALAADRWTSEDDATPESLASIADDAVAAHRRAQGGGSGIDVIASTYGGVRVCRRVSDETPAHAPAELPQGLVLEAFRCPDSASTRELLARVRTLSPADYDRLTGPAREGADEVVLGLERGDVTAILAGLDRQRLAMQALGEAADAPILPPYLLELGQIAAQEGAVLAQAGAGGGDVAFYAGREPSSAALRGEAARLGLASVPLVWSARGVHVASPTMGGSAPQTPQPLG